MDKLDKIFQMQECLDSYLIEERGLDYPPEEWIKKQVLAVISELAELLDEVNFKWWKNPKEIDSGKVKEELVDILHFFLGMCIKAGLSSQELFEIYCAKNQENFDRQTGKSAKAGYKLDDIKKKP